MEIGVVGLGRMGANMARRLARAGHVVHVQNRTYATAQQLAAEEVRVRAVPTLARLVEALAPPRTVWMMLPAGAPTSQAVDALLARLAPEDLLVDGGNAHYRASMEHARRAAERGVEFVDCGTSGGVWGLTEGYSMMLGGSPAGIDRLRPILESLAPAPDRGWGRVGPSGAGHFVKMIHNAIEYGMMESYAEGFDILQSRPDLDLDLHRIAEIWRFGSVVRSWLLDLIAGILADDPSLADVAPRVPDSGEGRWAVAEAIDREVPAPVITLALLARLTSRRSDSYSAKLLAALRGRFGGHDVARPPREVE